MKNISSNIFPNVSKLSLSEISDYPGVGKCSHVVISNGKVVQSCSSNYGLLKNENFFTTFEEKMKEEHINFTATYRNVEDAQFVADYVLDGEIIRRFEVLAEVPVIDMKEFVKGVCDRTKLFKFEKSDKNPDPSLNAQFILDKVAIESSKLQTVSNRWLVYNAFNEWLNNDERNKKTDSMRTEIDSKIFETVEAM